MSYNPHQFRHLFKKGLFGFPNRPLKDWGESHRLFALNQEPQIRESKKLAPGLLLKGGHLKTEGGFSNYLIFEINTRLRPVEIHYSAKPDYPLTAFKKIEAGLALINLGYFYLTTHEKLDPAPPPPIRVSNLAVYQNRIVNLPIANRSAFLIFKDGSFELAFVKARGKLNVNGQVLGWSGSKTNYRSDVTIYNSSNLAITNVEDPIIGPYRSANRTYLKASRGKKLVIVKINQGRFKVDFVTKSKVLLNQRQLVFEVKQKLNIKKGDEIYFETLDKFHFSDIKFAVSIGPVLKKETEQRVKQVLAEGLDVDPFLSNWPHREDFNLARGCLVRLGRYRLAAVLVDGIPQAGQVYPGVTPGQLAEFVNDLYPDHQIAVCNDPANTLKAIYLNGRKTHVFGNTHYLAYRRLKNGRLKFWPNGTLGRKTHTMLVVK